MSPEGLKINVTQLFRYLHFFSLIIYNMRKSQDSKLFIWCQDQGADSNQLNRRRPKVFFLSYLITL